LCLIFIDTIIELYDSIFLNTKLNNMKLILKIQIVLCLCLVGFNLQAQLTTTVPLNDKVKHGKLENGLTYYIMHNEEPKDRASFYFVQNVGAILEEDAQNGLAHFLEHMAFNGLDNFPGKNMLDYLEINGIQFGRDINAYTAQDETVYNISNIPVNNEGLIDSTLLVLHDWSGGLLLEAAEIESERGVIHEEWRTRRNVRKRLNDQSSAVMYNNSKYAKRDVIGSLDVIDNFEHAALREYYDKWYRPDLQAIVIVGDLDVDVIETKIKALFSDIPVKENVAERTYYEINDSKELGYVVAKDKEAKNLSIMWLFRKDAAIVKNEASLKNDMLQSMFASMLNARLSEKTKKLESAALGLFVGGFDMTRTKASNYLYVSPKNGQELKAFEEIQVELQRVVSHGFTASELKRTKAQLLRSYESYNANKDKIANDKWAKQLGDLYLKATPFPSVEWEMNFANNTIADITLAEINALVNNFSNVDNSALILQGPDNSEQKFPSKEELLKIVAEVKSQKIDAYVDDAGDKPLVEKDLKKVEIISSSEIEAFGAKSYILKNGAKVVILPTDHSKDKISFSAFSFGGSSLISTNDLVSADIATNLAQISGIGNFNVTQLQKKLAGQIVSLSPSLGEVSEGFRGSASPQDFETLLKLIYLNFENPRFDKDALDAQLAKWRNYIINKKVDNASALQDSVILANSNYSDRTLLFNEEFINKVNFEKAVEIFNDRFSDASDFTFIFVGNINTEDHLELIQKYVGNISSKNRTENYIDHKEGPAKGITSNIFEREMAVPKSTVTYSMHGDIKYNLKNKLMVSVVSQLLSKRYMVTIREEEGGSYGVGVRPSVSMLPSPKFSISINFDCAPEKRVRLSEIVNQEIESIKTELCNADDLTEIKNNYLKNREEAELNNSFWMQSLKSNLMMGTKFTNKEDYSNLINSIDSKMVKKFAKKHLKNVDIVEVVMNPKKK